MLTPELEESLYSARRDALRRGFGELTIEHLTLILLDNKLVKPFVESESINIAALRDNLLGLIHKKPPLPHHRFENVGGVQCAACPPAPMSVWMSSIKSMMPGWRLHSSHKSRMRCSKSPR